MKKSTKGFIAGSLIASGAIAGLYYAKKQGYLDKAIDFVKDSIQKNPEEDADIFEEAAAEAADSFTAPEAAEISEPAAAETDKEIISDERSYVSLDFETPARPVEAETDSTAAAETAAADDTDTE